jgi:hypothetical protein
MSGDHRDMVDAAGRSRPGDHLKAAVSSEVDVAALSEGDRAMLARWVADASSSGSSIETPNRMARGWRRITLVVMTGAALLLAPWLGVLSTTLPSRHASDQWRLAWTMFDVALLLVFLATAWTGWRNRQLVITALVVLGTLLLCDAWFDVTLSWGTSEQTASILTAVLLEVPFAVVAIVIAHWLLHEVTHYVWHLEGRPDPVIPLHRVPLTFARDIAPESD